MTFHSIKKPIIVAFFFLIGSSAIAQQIKFDSLLNQFKEFRLNNLQEKIYVHTDQQFYLTGERLLFKVYCVEGSFHKPVNISSIAYVEILDRNNNSIVSAKIQLKNGCGSGSLFLPATIGSDKYVLRGYTNWMKNFDQNYFFSKSISIVNPFVKLEKETKSKKVELDFQLFPEGGTLLLNTICKVGFKGTDENGLGVSFTGKLIADSDTLLNFEPFQFGIGSFVFKPEAGKKYSVFIKSAIGKRVIPMPEVKKTGYALKTETTTTGVKIKIESSADKNNTPVFLLIHARQIVSLSQIGIITENAVNFFVESKNLKEGINHITIFNANALPVAERLFFKVPSNALSKIATAKDEYSQRKQVKVDLQSLKDAELSMTVFRIDSLALDHSANIEDYIWLTSDLKGFIQSPEYYLSGSEKSQQAADNLMLTQGWRRFRWEEMDKQKLPHYLPETHTHTLSGHVFTSFGKEAKNVSCFLSSPSKEINTYVSKSNNTGDIFFEPKVFFGERKMIFQAKYQVDSIYKIVIDNPFIKSSSINQLVPLKLFETTKSLLVNRSVAMQVQDVYYPTNFPKLKNDSLSFFGKPDETYHLDDYTRFPVMEEVMREYVKGVEVRRRKDGFHFNVLDNVNRTIFNDDPLVLIDGVPIFDINRIMEFDPLKIEKLEVVDRKFYIGSWACPGIVSYSTYQNDLGGFELDASALVLNYEGLQSTLEFYSPQYATDESRLSRLPDLRSLLYWNPTVVTDDKGFATIQFYTSDLKGNFRVEVEGMDKKGNPVKGVTTFKVVD
jgi:hypothetical protein